MKLISILTTAFILVSQFSNAQSDSTKAKSLVTRWAKDVKISNVLGEYPRPQLVRNNWVNLNGQWLYCITDSSVKVPGPFEQKIIVPFPIESTLSGVRKPLNPNQLLWYKRTIDIPELELGKRKILHFGAVDFLATVYINGHKTGIHTGGYQEFSFDITKDLRKGNNEILICVWDPSDQGNNPFGKQVLYPEGIMYTASSGIWQTVWMETVPEVYINKLRMTPDVDKSALILEIEAVKQSDVIVKVMTSGNVMAEVKSITGKSFEVPIKSPRLWSPNDPFLYDLEITLTQNGKPIDKVTSYFGMRKIEVKNDSEGQARIYLNNINTFNLGVLDQGFWPDGLHTAPTDEALKWDVEIIKEMGFNCIRKHIKIEPARWYYHCDKLGMLVWQDMPFPSNLSNEAKAQYEKENEENIKQLYNYPSIVCWVLFNEGWKRYDQKRLTDWMKNNDKSRLIDGHSGENYDRKAPKDDKEKWVNSDMTDIHDYPGPGIPPSHIGKARVLGEWGGVRVVTPGHQWIPGQGWGYIESSPKDFENKYKYMLKHLKVLQEEGLSASIYTQPFDVELEENGLITYDREVYKIPVKKLKEYNSIITNTNP